MNIKTIVLAAAVMMASANVLCAQDVKVKRGKVTMTEAQYNELLARSKALDEAQAEIANLKARYAAPKMSNFNDSVSYAIGRDMYARWTQQGLGINPMMISQSFKDDAQGFSQLSDAQANSLLRRFQEESIRKQRADIQENIDAGAKFMQEISKNKSVYTTPSGLKYRKLKEGNGHRPKATDRVKVHYTGTLINGTKFDSSVDRGEPLTFPLNQVIPGWTEGLQLMDEGSKYILYIPYNLGYGEQPAGSIPPGSTLIFEVELIEINPAR